MNKPSHDKVTQRHLNRLAYLYVRQSTIRQVIENIESTQRQYALKERAIALGWLKENVVIIDEDQGQSGANVADRKGFQTLVTEISLGKVGIVMGLEVSRLVRNCKEWHNLLGICAFKNTLILDEAGLYDPSNFNDRLLLGLKGTMSEAELYVLRDRLQGGINNKARRGELKIGLPVGFVYDHTNRVILDPDQRVQKTIRYFFETFNRTGSACQIVKVFKKEEILFPRHSKAGAGNLRWLPLETSTALRTLHNPRYTGAFVYGKQESRKDLDGKVYHRKRETKEWHTLLKGVHPAYISWEQYEENQKRLLQNLRNVAGDQARPPREGPALLQGIVVCGKCGKHMTLRYSVKNDKQVPNYVCQSDGIEKGNTICQFVQGEQIDQMIEKLLLKNFNLPTLEVTLNVQKELEARFNEVKLLRKQKVESIRLEAEQAKAYYMCVNPHNRLVADNLEITWNEKLRHLKIAQQEYDEFCAEKTQYLDEKEKAKIFELVNDFSKLWKSKQTSHLDRKRMLSFLIEDVTLLKEENIRVNVRFKGGKIQSFELPRLLTSAEKYKTDPKIISLIDQLFNRYCQDEIVEKLNKKGYRSGYNKPFTSIIITRLRREYKLATRYERLRKKGLLTIREMAVLTNSTPKLVKFFRAEGLLTGFRCNAKNEYLYLKPDTKTMKQIKNHPIFGSFQRGAV